MIIRSRTSRSAFGAYAALDDVSARRCPAGELVALLGPSGSGKTTLLRVLAGLETPRPRRVLLRRRRRHRALDPRAASVGFVFQHYALFRHMTVVENIAFGLRVRNAAARRAIRARVRELLALVQLDGLGASLSVASSRAASASASRSPARSRPRRSVLLLDEPFGALDAQVRTELRSWLRRLHDELHVTTVFVTHDQDEALEVADRSS